jgi:hypothetical protein
MQTAERIFKLLGVMLVVLLFFAIKIFIGLAIISISIVPLTFVYCLVTGRSYSSTIDSSNMLYKLNKMGQWSIITALAIGIFYVIFKF